MNALRVIAWMEGVSFLLFGVSMPLKYGFDIPEPNYVIGMVHGILFVIYNLLILKHSKLKNWSIREIIFLCFLSLVPFGTFYGDHKYFKR
ncbi:MAG: DUF3817 domain-containing protein [Bacteroidota bacterium]|nr:DUF3817 domain-containing protein [Bacteroidota bacterium]MEC8459664.1 DUF3817 domain-containing protein [Bacteroidota bacterium]|tara:strand:- start:493 stop:762 length:270 start_codon:yes stop_codon:yes gene_type:complete